MENTTKSLASFLPSVLVEMVLHYYFPSCFDGNETRTKLNEAIAPHFQDLLKCFSQNPEDKLVEAKLQKVEAVFEINSFSQWDLLVSATQNGLCPLLLDLGTRKGVTDYIDFVKETEMQSCVMFGVDFELRPFVSFLVDVTIITISSSSSIETKNPKVFTLFQRYPDSTMWTFAGSYANEFFLTRDSDEIIKTTSLLFQHKQAQTKTEWFQIEIKLKENPAQKRNKS